MNVDLLNGLDLFSGLGGIAEALSPWVETVAYCENERHAQAELLSRMSRGEIHTAPIWDDVTTLKGRDLPEINFISAGFPCQDISCAGRRAGLAGKRSGLFFEIPRIICEIRPEFVFLENTPGIFVPPARRKKEPTPLGIVASEMAALGYDCRWSVLSAFDVGAPHLRERWWCLARRKDVDDTKGRRRRVRNTDDERQTKGALNAFSNSSKGMADAECLRKLQSEGSEQEQRQRSSNGGKTMAYTDSRQPLGKEKEIQTRRHTTDGGGGNVPDTDGLRCELRRFSRERIRRKHKARNETGTGCKEVADTDSGRLERSSAKRRQRAGNVKRRGGEGSEDVADTNGEGLEKWEGKRSNSRQERKTPVGSNWQTGIRYDWSTEPNVGRVAYGVPFRSNRIMRLGLTVVPDSAREAFKRLMGIDE